MSDEMGDGDSDGEFFSRPSPPPKMTVARRPEYSPSRDKVTYNYEFVASSSSSDEDEPPKKVTKKKTAKKKKIEEAPQEELKPAPYFAALLGQTIKVSPPPVVAAPAAPLPQAGPPLYGTPPTTFPMGAMPSNQPFMNMAPMNNMGVPSMNNIVPPMNNMGPMNPIGMGPMNPMNPMGGMNMNPMGQSGPMVMPNQLGMGGPPNIGMNMHNMGMNMVAPSMGMGMNGPPNMGGVNMGGMGMNMNGPPNMGMNMNVPPNMGMNMNGPHNMGMNMNGPPNMGMNMNGPPNVGMNINGPPNMGMMNMQMTMGGGINMGGPPNIGMNLGGPQNMGGPANMGMNIGAPPNMGMNINGPHNMGMNLNGPPNMACPPPNMGNQYRPNINNINVPPPSMNAQNIRMGMSGINSNNTLPMGANSGTTPGPTRWQAPTNATISKPPVLNNSVRAQQYMARLKGPPRSASLVSTTASSSIADEASSSDPVNFKNDGSFYEMFQKMKGDEPAPKEVVNMPVAVMAAKQPEYSELSTAPFDPRFPNTNQTKHCYTSFLDYHRCQKARGADYEPCNYFKRVFNSMCPNAWVEKWNEQLEAGTFPGRI